jgi:hypothetical protein
MSKKTMLLVFAVISAASFALPAMVAAQEIHLEGVTSFSGSAGPTSFSAEGEPTITCESGGVEGSVQAGGTTGTYTYDFTGCHTTVFGFTSKCHTSGSALDNTIHEVGTLHFITIPIFGGKAGFETLETRTVTCAGISNTVYHGSVIGTITSPACGAESNELTMKFTAAGTNQEHKLYTGVSYDITATTGEGGSAKTAGFTSTMTVKSATKGKLNCT